MKYQSIFNEIISGRSSRQFRLVSFAQQAEIQLNKLVLLCRRTMRWIAAIAGFFLIFIFPRDIEARVSRITLKSFKI